MIFMEWKGLRESENVERAQRTGHPVYGEMETLTNLARGEVMRVTADGLYNECAPEMMAHFKSAVSGEGVGFSVSQLIGKLTQTPCEAKVSAFFNEYSRGEGFEIEFNHAGWQALRVMDAPQEAAAAQQIPEEEKYTKLSPDAGVKSGM